MRPLKLTTKSFSRQSSRSRSLGCGSGLRQGNLWPGLLDRILNADNATLGTANST
jgi:hypothetical protein